MLFPHNVTIEVRGGSVRGLNPDERTMALCLQRTLLDGGCEHVDNLCDATDGLKSESVDGNNNVSITNSSSMQATTIQEERRQLELNNLRKRTLKRPTSYNPNKPGSYTKSERIRMRTVRKQREAMIRRIQRSSKATTSTAGGDDADDESALPTAINAGFQLHRNDSLERRLQLLNGDITFMMDEIGEPLSQFLDDSSRCSIDTNTDTITATTTNIVLGDQMGYAPCDEEFLLEQCDNNDETTAAAVMKKVSLGPISLLTSQCITIVHNCLDINERILE